MTQQTNPTETVAIVGRPNVGKSALFNCLARRTISIVHDMPGVTRDRISVPCERPGKTPYTLIDTGGICGILEDGLQERAKAEAEIALESSDLVLFTVDGQEGLTLVDLEVASVLRKAGCQVFLVVNKMDVPDHEDRISEFAKLGFTAIFPVSAVHRRGMEKLHAAIDRALPGREATAESAKQPIRLAMLGRPNVGKSSLINAILGDDRTIVSEISGTTRDAVDIPYERGGQPFVLIDTAGIRRQSRLHTQVEAFSVKKSLSSIRRADICALVVDAREVTAQDRKIAGHILKENKPCVVIVNKFDLWHPGAAKKDRMEMLKEEIQRELFFLHYAPVALVSAKEGENLNRVFGAVESVVRAARNDIGTGALNRLLRDAVAKNPAPMREGRRFNLLYASRLKNDRPRPVEPVKAVLFTNRGRLLPKTYMRYLENQLREEHDFTGLPLVFYVRDKGSRVAGA